MLISLIIWFTEGSHLLAAESTPLRRSKIRKWDICFLYSLTYSYTYGPSEYSKRHIIAIGDYYAIVKKLASLKNDKDGLTKYVQERIQVSIAISNVRASRPTYATPNSSLASHSMLISAMHGISRPALIALDSFEIWKKGVKMRKLTLLSFHIR